jgi:hypothetical protein
MIIEPTVRGTWIAHGRAGGIPFVAEADTRDEAFRAALAAIHDGTARRKLEGLSDGAAYVFRRGIRDAIDPYAL